MRWAVGVLLALLSLQLASAITMDCPGTAEQYKDFDIGVSHAGATQVRAYYHGTWHVQSGSSAYWTLSESTTGDKFYWGDAYVGGIWISTGDDQCVVEIIQHVDTPGTMTLSVTPITIEYGQSFSISASFSDVDGTREIQVKRGLTTIGTKTTCSGTSCSYTLTDTPPSTGTITYTAIGYDVDENPSTDSESRTVTGPSLPAVSLVVTPTSLTIGQPASFSVSATDAGYDLSRITVFYGDGASNYQLCSGGSCSRMWSHSYTTSGTKNAYATVLDASGHTSQSAFVPVYVSAPADSDGDGIPDSSDVCDSTPSSWRPIVTSPTDPYLGCACGEIVNFVPDPTRDINPCTDDSCSIVGGAFVPVHTPVPDGTQPEGYTDGCKGADWFDFFCQAGVIASIVTPNHPSCVACVPHTYQACWDSDPYWYDSCHNRQERLDDCGPGEQCVAEGGVAWCEALPCTPSCKGAVCGSPDGCGGFCDVESCVPPRTCEPSGSTYVCSCNACTGSEPFCSGNALVTCTAGCQQSQTCGTSTPFCVGTACVECRFTSDCGTGENCTAGVCTTIPPPTGCSSDADCGGSTPYCDTENGKCVQCLIASHCADGDGCTSDACTSSICTHAPIAAICPSPNDVPCGQPVLPTNGCGDCEGLGTFCSSGHCADFDGWACYACATSGDCPAGYRCDEGTCTASAVTITSVPDGSTTLIEGSTLTVRYNLTPENDDARLRLLGWPEEDLVFHRILTASTGRTDVGVHAVAVEAFIPASIGDEIILGDNEQYPLTVTVRCDPDNECCDPGDLYYQSNNEPCDYDGDGNSNDGICQGACVQNCVRTEQTACRGDELWYLDTCGNWYERIQDCAATGQVCVEERCE